MPHVVEVVNHILVPDIPEIELPPEDGIPLESNWHRIQINLLVDCVRQRWRGRTDFFAGGNMFVYYSLRQARDKDYKGPDFFLVRDVDGSYDRPAWIAWEEDGRLPDLIVELLSPSTAAEDLGRKKNLYERVFKTAEYFAYDPETGILRGWQWTSRGYQPMQATTRKRFPSEQLEASFGLWEGEYQGLHATWLRLFSGEGELLPTGEEAEHQRADTAEAEVARLRVELERHTL